MSESIEPPDPQVPSGPSGPSGPSVPSLIIYSKNILLIDKRVESYDTIVSATNPSLCIPILFDYYQDTIEDIKTRIVDNVEISQTDTNDKFSFQSIGIVQHNTRNSNYIFVNKQQNANTCILFDVSNADPELLSWAPIRDFMLWCKTEYSIQNFDMMACALYADPNWKYVIDNLEIITNVNIRASIDNTGSAALGGNWFLETDNINLKDVYFTDDILNYAGILPSDVITYTWNITYTIGAGGRPGDGAYYESGDANGRSGTSTTATINNVTISNQIILTGSGGGGGRFNGNTYYGYPSPGETGGSGGGATASPESNNAKTINGGYGTGVWTNTNDYGGGAGGSINGGVGDWYTDINYGDNAANVTDFQYLSAALVGTGYSMGIGGLGFGTVGVAGNFNNGNAGTGIGAGGGGAGRNGGNGGSGSFGGGGGGGAGYYGHNWYGGYGGGGVIILRLDNSTNIVLTSGSDALYTHTGTSLQIWVIGGGGGGAGATYYDNDYGSGGGAGGMVYYISRIIPTIRDFSNITLPNASIGSLVTISPSSTSSGAITYSSTNTNVATIRADVSVNALNFDGGPYNTGDYINIGTPSILQDINGIGFRKNMTVECWFKTTDTSAQKSMSNLISKFTRADDSQYSTFNLYMNTSGSIVGTITSANSPSKTLYTLATTTKYNDSLWHHSALSFDSVSGRVNLYVDGVNVFADISASFGLLPFNYTPVIIGNDESGRYAGNNDRQFRGSICEVRFWALEQSATDISNNYRRILTGTEPGLVGYLRLNQGVAAGSNALITTATNNMVSGGFDGLLNNFALTGATSNWVTGVTPISPVKDVSINIINAGSTIIRATQAATTSYDISFIECTLTVRTLPTIHNFSNITIPNASIGSLVTIPTLTSDSNGAFTYDVTNTAIAEINGNSYFIKSAGSTTIRVTQAAYGIYDTTFIDGSLTVLTLPTINNFLNIIQPNSSIGSSFTITPPSSNSNGAITYSSTSPGVATVINNTGNALNFDGANDYIDFGIPAFMQTTQLRQTMTIECWFKTTDTADQKGNATLISQWIGGDINNNMFSLFLGPTGRVYFWCSNVNNNFTGIATTTTYLDMKWHHVCATFNYSDGAIKIYVDGVNQVSANNTASVALKNNTILKLIVGCDAAGAGTATNRQFRGSIAELRIWNVVRTPTDISNNLYKSLNGNETGLVLYNRLNQGTANGSNAGITTATSNMLSGGITGTLSGFALTGATSNWVYGPPLSPTINIVGVGSTTIRATQAAYGIYDTNFIDCSLTVLTLPTIRDFSNIIQPYSSIGSLVPITPPISNSSGAFTYDVSNIVIAEIRNGNYYFVKSVGSTTIRATQAVYGIYDTKYIDCSLTVLTLSTISNFSNITIPNASIGSLVTISKPTSDSSGSFTYDISNTSIATVITDVSVNALNFDGGGWNDSDYIDIGTPPILQDLTGIGFRKNMTVECWFKTTDNSNQKSSSNLVSKYTSAGYNTATFNIYMTPDGRIGTTITNNYNSSNSTFYTQLTTASYKDTNWHHVALSYDSSSGRVKTYIDGLIVVSDISSSFGLLANNNIPVVIGNDYAGSTNGNVNDRQFRGSICEVRFWAVERSEIDIYNNYRRILTGTEYGLVGYLRLNQGVADGTNTITTATNNMVSGGFTGTLYNFTLNGPTSNWVTGVTPIRPVNDTINVKSVGSTNITLTQAAYDIYDTTSVTRSLTVLKLPTIRDFSNITITTTTNNFGSYQITPISDSSGTFTYNSTNAQVATITNLGVYTVKGYGTTTIKLKQDASGIYDTISLERTLTVLTLSTISNFSNITIPNASIGSLVTISKPTSDSSGAFTYDISNTSIATIITDVSVNALNFDGSGGGVGDYINIGTPSILQDLSGIGFRKNMTVECWFKTTDYSNQKGTSSLVSKYDTGGYASQATFNLYMIPDGRIGITITNNSGAGYGQQTPASYKDTNWHHVALSYDSSSGRVKTYIDGLIVVSDISSSFGLLANNNIPVVIGNDYAGSTNGNVNDRQFRGSICEVRFWAVERSEIDIYNNYRRILTGTEYGLVGYLRLNQGVADGTNTITTATNNMVSGGFTGTLYNFTLNGPTSNWVTGVTPIRPVNDTINVKSVGSTNITLTQAAYDIYDTTSVTRSLTVLKLPTIQPIQNRIIPNASINISISVTPISDSSGAFTYTSSNPLVATITNSGFYTALSAGTTTITVTQAAYDIFDTTSTTFTITVLTIPTIRDLSNIIQPNSSINSSFTIRPNSDSSGAFTYSSSTNVVTIGDSTGVYTVNSPGFTIITITQAAYGIYDRIVIERSLNVLFIPTISNFSNIIKSNTSIYDIFKIDPSSNSSGAFTYTSSNEDVATIDASSGVYMIKAEGTTTIMLTQAARGIFDTTSISRLLTVTSVKIIPTIDPYPNIIRANATIGSSFRISPSSNSGGAFTYTSSNPLVATITNSGDYTVLSSGRTTITGIQIPNDIFDTASINIKLLVTISGDINYSIGASAGVGGQDTLTYYNTTSPLTNYSDVSEYEYSVDYNINLQPGDDLYSIDISKNIVNGTRYYFRYCIVNAAGDCTPYTLSNSSNYNKTSTIPGTLPQPPDFINAVAADRKVSLYFNWTTVPPGIDKTGGYPILDYKIERYIVTDVNDNNVYTLDKIYNNVTGPFYEDSAIRFNGVLYKYSIYSRNEIGYSSRPTEILECPTRKSGVVYNVNSYIDNNQITLTWNAPSSQINETPLIEYYIEYRIFDFNKDVPLIPPQNLQESLTNTTIVGKNIDYINSITVDDTLWAKLTMPITSIYTNSTVRSYTILDLVNGEAYVFRIGAVTKNALGIRFVGNIQNYTGFSPYLTHPKIIGRPPLQITDDLYFNNGNEQVNISWSSSDINNTIQGITNFIVELRIFGSNEMWTILKYPYDSCVIRYDNFGQRVYYTININNLNNNVSSITTYNSHTYEIKLYAENITGYTNDNDKLNINTYFIEHPIYDTYNGIPLVRYIRPGNIATVIGF